jgi:hypothetical protein
VRVFVNNVISCGHHMNYLLVNKYDLVNSADHRVIDKAIVLFLIYTVAKQDILFSHT